VVAGTVVDSEGRPVPGAIVTLTAAGAVEPTASDETKHKGTFKLEVDGEPGAYDLRVEAMGYSPFEDDLDLEAGTRVEASVSLVPAALAQRQTAIDAYNAAVAALQAGDAALGRSHLEAAIATDPDLPEPHLVLARSTKPRSARWRSTWKSVPTTRTLAVWRTRRIAVSAPRRA
jgi:hypothetical protein